MSIALMVLIGGPLVCLPSPILSLCSGGDVLLAANAMDSLRIAGCALLFDVVGMVLMSALMGAGDSQRVALISTGLQWFVSLPLTYLVATVLGGGLLEIWIIQSLARVIQAGVFAALWRGTSWQGIRV